MSKDFKRILDAGSQLVKYPTSISNNPVTVVSHDQLEKVIAHYSFEKKAIFCQTILLASWSMALRLANDVQRGIQQENKMYAEWTEERSSGIQRRREYTDYIQLCKELGMDLCYAESTIQALKWIDINL